MHRNRLSSLIIRVLILSRRLLYFLFAVIAFTVAYALYDPARRVHLFNLLRRASSSFLSTLGTTGLGFITPIIVSLASIAVALLFIFALQGKTTMVKNWKENAGVAALVTMAVILMVYGPMFGWKVVETVYDEHNRLINIRNVYASANLQYAAENQKLAEQIQVLRPEPDAVEQPRNKPLLATNKQSPCVHPSKFDVKVVRSLTPQSPYLKSLTVRPQGAQHLRIYHTGNINSSPRRDSDIVSVGAMATDITFHKKAPRVFTIRFDSPADFSILCIDQILK